MYTQSSDLRKICVSTNTEESGNQSGVIASAKEAFIK